MYETNARTDREQEAPPPPGTFDRTPPLQGAGSASTWVGPHAMADQSQPAARVWDGATTTETDIPTGGPPAETQPPLFMAATTKEAITDAPDVALSDQKPEVPLGVLAVSGQVPSDRGKAGKGPQKATKENQPAPPPADAGGTGRPPKPPRPSGGSVGDDPHDRPDRPDRSPESRQSRRAGIESVQRPPEHIAAIDKVIDYENAAPTLGRRPTTPALVVEACYEVLAHPGGTCTPEIGYRLGLDHDVLRTALPGLAALGLVIETGYIRPEGGVGRSAALYLPNQELAKFARDYNNLRLDVLREQLLARLRNLETGKLEQQILGLFAAAYGTELGDTTSPNANELAEQLGVHAEAVRFYGFNGFVAARPGLKALVDYQLKSEIAARRAQRANEA